MKFFLSFSPAIVHFYYICRKTELMNIIGRQDEIKDFERWYESGKPEFIAVYGRRRVGKTYLVNTLYAEQYAFSTTGIIDGNKEDELTAFYMSLKEYGYAGHKPRTWMSAFEALRLTLENRKQKGKRMVVFIDELPCLATPKSGLIKALDYFWNSWGCRQDSLFMVVCGSATSWIIRNIIDNKGGLHNRITHEKHLFPFTLKETREYILNSGIRWPDINILQVYMALGGIPYYLGMLNKDLSLTDNIDALFFAGEKPLMKEYNRLYKSIFKESEKYEAVIKALSTNKKGYTRKELAEKLKVEDNGHFGDILQDLVNCDFIREYNTIGKKIRQNRSLYQLVDFYSIFYHTFASKRQSDEHYWAHTLNTPAQNNWYGHAFERVAMAHIPQILKALGIDRILTEYGSWRSEDPSGGAQIDLVISRADNMINICEAKYSASEYSLSKDEAMKLTHRMEQFKKETETRKGLFITLITTHGLTRNMWSETANSVVTMQDLFK